MIIGVDAGCLGVDDKRLKVGVYTVAKNLFEELGRIDKKNTYLLYSFYPIEKTLLRRFGSRVKNVIVKPLRGWLTLWLPLRLIKDKPDIFLCLGQSIPRRYFLSPKTHYIGFIYDIAFEKFPQMYPDSLPKLRRNTLALVKQADSIVTISQATKDDLVRIYSISPDVIIIAYPGVSDEVYVGRTTYSSKKPYFLFVGALKRTKNVSGIVRAFAYFSGKTDTPFFLSIVGGDKWFDPNIKRALGEIPAFIRKRIKFLGHVENRTLYNLYSGAFAFVSPSFYEGFGITLVEAMALGCPVITSPRGSIPEVVGNAVLVVDPDDYEAIGEALVKLARDSALRKDLIERGIENSKRFSNQEFAQIIYMEIQKYEKRT